MDNSIALLTFITCAASLTMLGSGSHVSGDRDVRN